MADATPNSKSKEKPEYDSLFRDEDLGARSFILYFAVCFLCNGLMCALTIFLWSSCGFGDDSMSFLEDNYDKQLYPFCASMFILTVMYLLDFFSPPFTQDGGRFGKTAFQSIVGRALLVSAGALFILSCFLLAETYPYVPMLLTIFLCPGSTAMVRHLIKPKQSVEDLPQEQAAAIIEKGDVANKMRYLKGIVGEEKDVTAFYIGAMYSFFGCSAGSLLSWLLWAHYSEENLNHFLSLTAAEQEARFIKWVCPMVLALSNFVFGLFVVLRVVMQRNYARTDIYRARLVADGMRSSLQEDMQKHKATLNLARLSKGGGTASSAAADAKLDERFAAQHNQNIRQLAMIVKVVMCTFVLFIGLLYVATQLLYANVYVASMVLGMLGAFFIVFVVFTYLSFKRIVHAMGQWIKDLPVWRTIKWVLKRDWLRTMFICPGLPMIPLVLALSITNQYVRKCRGVYKNVPETLQEELGEDPSKLLLTPRVHTILKKVRSWDWLSLAWWCYFWCALFVAYNLTPPILNVGLSWMRDALRLWPFALILVMTFFIGVGAFLCPVVPGMTVYIFGGLIVANTCPPPDRGVDAWVSWQEDTMNGEILPINEAGFWMGSIINIGLSWFLKLAACAVQQKLIGELLGSRMWVRQQVGVHKTHIRCIESILSKKGWTVGKVAILCGGPDWPTSVLAGVLRLSLFQCELGTIPIIGFVAPCALTGSLYLRKSEGGFWDKSANMMIIVSVFVNLLLWAVAAWAIAQELENNSEKLTAPLPQNVELVWLDYKAEEVDKRCRVTWSDVPLCIRWLYIVGAIAHIGVCHAIFWAYSYLIGAFQVQDRIALLQPYSGTLYFDGTDDCVTPDDCVTDDCRCTIKLFTMAAFIVFAVYFVSFVCYFQFSRWKTVKLRAPRKAAEAEISQTEAAWKEAWLKTANEQPAASTQTTKTVETASETDPSRADTLGPEQGADSKDSKQEEAQAIEQPQVVEPRPQLREPAAEQTPPPAEQSPPPVSIASEESKIIGEPVKLKSAPPTDRDVHEDLRELPMPLSEAVESRGKTSREDSQGHARHEAKDVPNEKLDTCETISDSADQSIRRGYIECICCQLATGSPVPQSEHSPKVWTASLGECPRLVVAAPPSR